MKRRRIGVRMELEYAYLRHIGIFAGIQDYARQNDWDLVIDEWADNMLPTRVTDRVEYDGLIGRIRALGGRRAIKLGIPVVNVWYASPVKHVPGVFPDYSLSGQQLAEHLLARGFSHIATAYHAGYLGSMAEADAIECAVRSAGFEPMPRLEWLKGRDGKPTHDPNAAQWRYALRQLDLWLDTLVPPVGICVDIISLARLIIERCRRRGWTVPGDVAITAGSNEVNLSERPAPSLTSMDYGYERVGYAAAELLDRLITRKKRNPRSRKWQEAETILLPPTGIFMRQSTDHYAVDDPLMRRVLRYIDENLGRQLTIDDIADAQHISRRALTKLFRDRLKRGVAEEVQRLRIERVKRALVSTDLPIKKIYRDAGFASPRTLNHAFQAAEGCSPTDYRNQRKAASNKT